MSGLFFWQTALLLSLAGMHLFFLEYYWYWQYVWIDVIPHFIGGMWVVSFLWWWHRRVMSRGNPHPMHLIYATLVAGIAWEIFEYTIGFTQGKIVFLDTSIDLFVGVAGAVVGIWLLLRYVRP